MRRAFTYGIAAIAVIGFGLVVERRCAGTPSNPQPGVVAGAVTRTERPPDVRSVSTITPGAITTTSSPSEVASDVLGSSPTAATAAEPESVPEHTGTVSKVPGIGSESEGAKNNYAERPDAAQQLGDAAAMVGRPFPLSASVERGCDRLSAGGGRDYCEEDRTLLSRLAQEPRDPVWASYAEARLRAFVLSEGDKYAVRALECRSTLCAIEVTSIHGPFLGIGYDAEKGSGLSGQSGLFGYEKNAYGLRVTVSLKVFARRR